MNFIKKIKLNFMPILRLTCYICGIIFSVLTIILTFFSGEDIVINNFFFFFCILVGIIIVSFAVSLTIIVTFLKQKKLWANGKNKVFAFYGDLFKIMEKQEKKIVLIPVNDTFETIIDDDLTQNKPLVSLLTIHGQWIKYMNSIGMDSKCLNKKISSDLKCKNIKPNKVYNDKEKIRGNKESYSIGTIATINGNNNTTFYLLAISNFDCNNSAKSSRRNIRNCIDDLIDFYGTNGQGYPIYIPLFGTDRSNADLTHQQAFKMIKNAVLTDEKSIKGTINIVVYKNDRDKVSIFK